MNELRDPRLWIWGAAVGAGVLLVFTAERHEWGNVLDAGLILAALLVALWLLRRSA